MNSYPCSTKMITTFHFLSVSGTAIGRYSSIIFIMLVLMFFFNKNMAYMLSVSVFMANASNSYEVGNVLLFLSKYSIFHLASTALLLLLTAVLIFLMNSS